MGTHLRAKGGGGGGANMGVHARSMAHVYSFYTQLLHAIFHNTLSNTCQLRDIKPTKEAESRGKSEVKTGSERYLARHSQCASLFSSSASRR